MPKFRITRADGTDLGTFTAPDADAALDAMARAAGFADFEEAATISTAFDGEVVIIPLTD